MYFIILPDYKRKKDHLNRNQIRLLKRISYNNAGRKITPKKKWVEMYFRNEQGFYCIISHNLI